MANPRQIIKRKKSVTNIRKITRTMQLIATARYQQTLKRAVSAKPYTEKITELVAQLSEAAADVEHPLLKIHENNRNAVVFMISANRGYCGGYNASLIRNTIQKLDELEGAGRHVELHAAGKKGIGYFHFRGREMAQTYTQFEDKPRFAEAEEIADDLIHRYGEEKIDEAYIVYMRFISTGVQRPKIIRLLPLSREENAEDTTPAGPSSTASLTYDFSPSPDALLAELLPLSVKTRLFGCFLDAAVSEQAARMVAMKSATDAAEDMIKFLSTQYNRARQTQITLELLDIIGGAEALK